MSGYLEKGIWKTGWYDTRRTGGEFVRTVAGFRNWVTADGSSGFKAEAGRYHLYVSLACPWAHRTVIFRKLKRLEEVISLSIVDPVMQRRRLGVQRRAGCIPDTVNGFRYLREAYTAADPQFSGRVTVPVLWDRQTGTIVNNESSEIIRMLNSAFAAFAPVTTDYYPEPLRAQIDAINALVYERVNNGVYRCGFASSQAAYDRAFDALFSALDELEDPARRIALSGRRDLDRGGLAAVHHAGALRRRLLRALQVQPAPNRGVSEPVHGCCASSTACRAWPRRSTWITSSATTT